MTFDLRTSHPPAASPMLLETSRELPLITFTAAVRGGSASDPAENAGLARFASRLMRRTAAGLAAEAIDIRIDALGAALGVEVGNTAASFQGAVISRSFGALIELLGDVLASPGWDPDEHARLQRETESELREVLDSDSSLARRWFRRRVFGDDPYGRSASGTLASIARLGMDDPRGWHRERLTAENLILAFSGDLDEALASAAATTLRHRLPSRAPWPLDASEPPRIPGRRLVFVDKPERTQTQILIGGLGTHPRDPDHVPLQVANTVFGGTISARLAREIRAERGWSYGAYSSLSIDRRRQAFSLWTFPKASDAAPCIRHQLGMLERWVAEGITEDELVQAQRYLTRSHVFSIDTASKRVSLALDQELFGLEPDYFERFPQRVEAVTREAANEAVSRRISTEDLLVVVVGTEAEIGAEVRAAIDRLGTYEVVPYDTDP